MLLSLIDKKKFFIRIKENAYNFMVINKTLLLSLNRRIDQKIDDYSLQLNNTIRKLLLIFYG